MSDVPARKGDFVREFKGGEDFEALSQAEAWLRAHGYSYGPLQGNEPCAIVFGVDRFVPKWRKIREYDWRDLAGEIYPLPVFGARRGVTVRLRRAPAAEVVSGPDADGGQPSQRLKRHRRAETSR